MINLNISSENYDHNLTTPIFRLPQGYRPSASVFKIVPCDSSIICRLQIISGGFVCIDYAYDLATNTIYTGNIPWVDLAVDFYID